MSESRRTTRPQFTHAARSQGFTLIEALMAGMILTASTLVITGSVNTSIKAAARARDNQRAAILLDELMAKIDLIGPYRLSTEGPFEGDFEGADAKFSWQLEIEPAVEFDLYEISATVTWLELDRQGSAVVSTLLFDPADSRNPILRWDDL
jgi:Tfp pilus assembly protein PilV